jgi:hypothetical protein
MELSPTAPKGGDQHPGFRQPALGGARTALTLEVSSAMPHFYSFTNFQNHGRLNDIDKI